MFSVGLNIKNNTEPLRKVSPDYIFNALRNPKPELAAAIRQLRAVRQLSYSQYSFLKTQLPYFVCAAFNPAFRKTENFAYTEYFIIDIDNISSADLILADLKTRITIDPRTLMCFVSPGEDGLKVIMKLKERCYDAGIYSVFYKKFIQNFRTMYSLSQAVDSKTSDVTRACFMSVDENAFYNPLSEPVDMSDIISLNDSSELLRQKHEIDAGQKKGENKTVAAVDPDKEAMCRISELLGARQPRQAQKKEIYVPDILNSLEEGIKTYVDQLGFTITEIINIQYGKKIRASLGLKKAEVNLFYGKRGFTTVKSPRTGTNDELNELLAQAVNAFISEY